MDENARPVTSATEAGKSPDQIRRDILQTQAEIEKTIIALEDRLSPRNIYQRSTEAAREGIGRASQSAGDAASRAASQARRRVDEFGRGRAAGAAAGIASLVMLVRGWRRQRARQRGRDAWEERAVFIAPTPASPRRRFNGRSGWITAMAVAGGIGAMAAQRAERQRKRRSAAVPVTTRIPVGHPESNYPAPPADDYTSRPVV